MFDIDAALRYLIQAEGSDLHLKVPVPPTARIHGHLSALEDEEPLKPADTERVLRYMLSDPTKLDEFDREGEVDFAYSIEGLARFRVNAFRQRGSISLVCRAIPYSVRTIEELNLPPVIRTLAEEERGIVLLTGTTGSGKSTTLAAMIDHMNQTMAKHVVTIEDPIEYLHRDRKSVINQREVGLDTTSFKRALRRVLRQDPDVILIGEMRDEETVQTALSAAETGHLVLSTVHTVDASESINRMLDFFPPHQHQQARAMIAGTLKGVVSQRLIPSSDGAGRVAVCEILVMTGRVRDMIMDPTQTGRLHEVIQEGEYYGMQTFDQALLGHLQGGRITMDEALKAATHPHDFKLLVAAEGRRSTSMADVTPNQDAGEDEPAPAPSTGNGNAHQPAPVTPLAPVAPERESPDPPVPDPPAPPAASSDEPAPPSSVPPPGVA
jgi:twitching motility protein PilT